MMAFPRPVLFISGNCVARTGARNLLLLDDAALHPHISLNTTTKSLRRPTSSISKIILVEAVMLVVEEETGEGTKRVVLNH